MKFAIALLAIALGGAAHATPDAPEDIAISLQALDSASLEKTVETIAHGDANTKSFVSADNPNNPEFVQFNKMLAKKVSSKWERPTYVELPVVSKSSVDKTTWLLLSVQNTVSTYYWLYNAQPGQWTPAVVAAVTTVMVNFAFVLKPSIALNMIDSTRSAISKFSKSMGLLKTEGAETEKFAMTADTVTSFAINFIFGGVYGAIFSWNDFLSLSQLPHLAGEIAKATALMTFLASTYDLAFLKWARQNPRVVPEEAVFNFYRVRGLSMAILWPALISAGGLMTSHYSAIQYGSLAFGTGGLLAIWKGEQAYSWVQSKIRRQSAAGKPARKCAELASVR